MFDSNEVQIPEISLRPNVVNGHLMEDKKKKKKNFGPQVESSHKCTHSILHPSHFHSIKQQKVPPVSTSHFLPLEQTWHTTFLHISQARDCPSILKLTPNQSEALTASLCI